MRWGLGALVLWSLIFFPLADTRSVPLVLLSLAGMLFIQGAYIGPQPAVFSELFPTAVRYSGASLSLTLGTLLGGAIAPIVATTLFEMTGTSTSRDGLHHGRLGDLLAVLARASGNLPRQPSDAGTEPPAVPRELPPLPRRRRGVPRRTLVPRHHPPGPDADPGRELRRARRLRCVHDRFAAARAVPLRGGVRAPRRGDAAQRPDRRGSVAGLDAEGRGDAARPRLLRQAGPRPGNVPGAAPDPVFQRGVGAAASR